MSTANEELWNEEKSSRRKLIRRASTFLVFLAIIVGLFCVWLTQPIFFNSSKSVSVVVVDAERLKAHVSKLSDEFYPRNHLNLQNLNATADYVRSEFEKTGGKVSEQRFTVNGAEYRNVRLELGEDEADGRIVVGAHYDSAFDTHGADDNASGVAGLIELANLIAKQNLSRKVEFVVFSLEEPPFFGTEEMGSFVHAQWLREKGVKVKLTICLEMIGYYTDEPHSQNFPLFLGRLLYPSTGNFAAVVGDFTNVNSVRQVKGAMATVDGVDTYSLNAPSFFGGVNLSDHRNYWQKGYDAVMITDTAFFRNKAYHTVGDTSDRLDYSKMAKVVDGVGRAIVKLAK